VEQNLNSGFKTPMKKLNRTSITNLSYNTLCIIFFGSPCICQNSYQKVNIFVKTKNAPNDLKCKINHTFFLETGVPKRGGGGGPTLGKNSQKIPFFWGGNVPNFACLVSTILNFFYPNISKHPTQIEYPKTKL